MRRAIAVVSALVCLVLLVGCGGEGEPIGNPDLDFKSVLDTETGMVFSLGDSKKSIDEKLGNPRYSERNQDFFYLISFVNVKYDENDDAIFIRIDNRRERFEFRDMRMNMTQRETRRNFRLNDRLSYWYSNYEKYYDENGEKTSRENAKYIARVLWDDAVNTRDNPSKMLSLMLLKVTD
jgi:hypothetical protein